MQSHPFILEPYKGKASRYACPNCNKPRTFARYIDTDTRQHLSPYAGRCNREDNCGYHYTPKQYFESNPDKLELYEKDHRSQPLPQPKPISYLTGETLKASLQGYGSNHFTNYLQGLFGPDMTSQLIGRYFIGTSKHWQGATVFYQIDSKGRIRAGKIILYNPNTGRRIKEPHNCITWVHTALQIPDYNLQQCFFGEHLLKAEPLKPVAIVESEKTAIIASIFLPDYIWLAAGSKGGLNSDKCQVLRGRKVMLYPDLKAYDDWSEKAKKLSGIATFAVSDLLERKASESDRAKGLDLADYLTQFNYNQFLKPPCPKKPALAREFYHCSFDELTAALGYDKAIEKVSYYQSLSRQYKNCKTFVVHNCKLLQSFQEQSQPLPLTA
ncbi:DUF6371 domain-containing protein [Pontibacter roseus]|uniref:DUF6371 domain-containing protein n=1 Tax=Pontibacter roseus TaxID=336989 RepID=UPI0003658175|nr:DUF6371 domain-containing protein [Pontibacter roseus]